MTGEDVRLTDMEERMTGRGITNQEENESPRRWPAGDGLSLFRRGGASGDEVGFDLAAAR